MPAYEFLYTEELYQAAGTLVIVVNEPWETLRDEDKILLEKILGSVKVAISGVQVIHTAATSLASLQVYNASKVISFGATIHESTSAYTCHKTENVAFIVCEPLSALDDAKKKSLWAALRQMFA